MMLEQIQELLDAPASGASAPTLASLERTLTDGYAHALALEAERWRLERRLGEVARGLAVNGTPQTAELASLGERLSGADDELQRLRTKLGSLRTRASRARASAN